MSDVIWAAIIAVAGAGITGTIAATVSIKLSASQRDIELAKVTGERDRLRDQFLEEERRGRQGMYQGLLGILDKLDMYGTGWPPRDDETFEKVLEEFNGFMGAIYLTGHDGVADKLDPLTTSFGALGADMVRLPGEGSRWERFQSVYPKHRKALIASTHQLILAMRADVNLVGGGQQGGNITPGHPASLPARIPHNHRESQGRVRPSEAPVCPGT